MTRRILSPLVLAGAVALAALTGCSTPPTATPDAGSEQTTPPEAPEETVVTDCPDGFTDAFAAAGTAGTDLGMDIEVGEISLSEFAEIAGVPADSFTGGCAVDMAISTLGTAIAYLPGATDVSDVFLAAGATDGGEQTSNGVTARSFLLDGRIIAVVPDGVAAIEAAGQPEALEFVDSFPDGLVMVTVTYDAS